MIFIFQIISLFSIFLFVWSYVFIGNYSQLNPKDCGISRISTLVDTNCFEWHKGYDSHLKTGRLVGHSDAPWVVLLGITYRSGRGSYCTGSIIADKWVITAAHCLEKIANVKIYLGYNYRLYDTNKVPFDESNKVYTHPKFVNHRNYDLGLIQMNKPINTSFGVNSICLPNKYFEDIINGPIVGYEYVMIAGWGPNQMVSHSEHRLRIVESIVLHTSRRAIKNEIFKVDNQGICAGDSGAGVWQYSMGRAVILSVLKSGPTDNRTGCEIDNDNRSAHSIWVDSQIDWIQNVTQLN